MTSTQSEKDSKLDHEKPNENSIRKLFIGVLICTLIFAVPLSYDQLKSMRLGFILYPVLLVGLSYLLTLLISHLSNYRTLTFSIFEYSLLSASCLAAGHFIAWFSTIGPEIAGNAFRGNILLVSLGCALISLLGSLWSAFAIRLINDRNSTEALLMAAFGWLIIVSVWIFAESNYWPFYSSGTGRHVSFLTVLAKSNEFRYGLYASLESLYWQFAWPLLWIVGILSVFPISRRDVRN